VAVRCFADTFLVNQKWVLRVNIGGENRPLRQAQKLWHSKKMKQYAFHIFQKPENYEKTTTIGRFFFDTVFDYITTFSSSSCKQ
jgi:hypothetical protein